MEAKRILFITQEIEPYVPESDYTTLGRKVPQQIQEKGREIRTFMPKWGNINERRNQLHEVIRLSGMNIIIDDTDHPLIIKVASIPAARMQVYFIDSDDYFHKRLSVADDKGKEYKDNAIRAIFYARGVLETVKKLRWVPDVIHCQGWISHLVPVFLKKAYKDDPIFSNCKVVLSLYNDTPKDILGKNFQKSLLFGGVTAKDVSLLENPDGINLAKTAARYSDGIILGSPDVDEEIVSWCKELGLPILPYNEEALTTGKYVDEYDGFYEQL